MRNYSLKAHGVAGQWGVAQWDLINSLTRGRAAHGVVGHFVEQRMVACSVAAATANVRLKPLAQAGVEIAELSWAMLFLSWKSSWARPQLLLTAGLGQLGMAQTSTTPPLSTRKTPHSTPIHTQGTTTNRYKTAHFSWEDVFKNLAYEITPYFLGPMPPGDFLDKFLPLGVTTSKSKSKSKSKFKFKHDMFKAVSNADLESSMYTEFVSSQDYHLFLVFIAVDRRNGMLWCHPRTDYI